MDEVLIARGFRGPRQASPDQVADTLVSFLGALDEVAGETLPWSSHALPGKVIAEPVNALQVISDAFRANTDAPHLSINQSYETQGTRVGKVRIGMSVGGYSDSPRLHNAFMVKWHGADLEALAGPILRQLVSAWDPDWAAVTSRSLADALGDVQPTGEPGPKLGYLTYPSAGRAQVLPNGLESHLLSVDNGGVIIGSADGDGFLPVDEVREFATEFRPSEAFSATPTSRSTF